MTALHAAPQPARLLVAEAWPLTPASMALWAQWRVSEGLARTNLERDLSEPEVRGLRQLSANLHDAGSPVGWLKHHFAKYPSLRVGLVGELLRGLRLTSARVVPDLVRACRAPEGWCETLLSRDLQRAAGSRPATKPEPVALDVERLPILPGPGGPRSVAEVAVTEVRLPEAHVPRLRTAVGNALVGLTARRVPAVRGEEATEREETSMATMMERLEGALAQRGLDIRYAVPKDAQAEIAREIGTTAATISQQVSALRRKRGVRYEGHAPQPAQSNGHAATAPRTAFEAAADVEAETPIRTPDICQEPQVFAAANIDAFDGEDDPIPDDEPGPAIQFSPAAEAQRLMLLAQAERDDARAEVAALEAGSARLAAAVTEAQRECEELRQALTVWREPQEPGWLTNDLRQLALELSGGERGEYRLTELGLPERARVLLLAAGLADYAARNEDLAIVREAA